jgi:hypothetical protein
MHSARRKRRYTDRSDVTASRVEIEERDRCQPVRQLFPVGRRHRRAH